MDTEPTQCPYTYLVLVSAADDVFFGDSQGVDAATSVALQHLGALQTLQVPDLYIHKHTEHYIVVYTQLGQVCLNHAMLDPITYQIGFTILHTL